jgi:4-aminobutyrate--pyruvate transaminase
MPVRSMTSAYVPMSALYINDKVYQTIADAAASIGTFGHGYTYSGHPLACAVALETLKIYESDRVVEHVKRVAPRLQEGLRKYTGHPIVGDVRGIGLIAALELAENPKARKPFDAARGVGAFFANAAQKHGLIVRVMGGDIIAVSPPLVITEAEIDELVARLSRALDLAAGAAHVA